MPSPVIASEGHSSWRTLHEWFNEPHGLRVDKAPEIRPGNHSDLPNLARNDDDHLRTVRFLQIDRSGYAADHTRQSSFDFHDLYVCGNRRMLVHTTVSRTPGVACIRNIRRSRDRGCRPPGAGSLVRDVRLHRLRGHRNLCDAFCQRKVACRSCRLVDDRHDYRFRSCISRRRRRYHDASGPRHRSFRSCHTRSHFCAPDLAHSLPAMPSIRTGIPSLDCSTVGDWKGQSAISSRAPETILHLSPSSSSISTNSKR